MASLNFDATNIQPADDFSPIPAGDYVAMIIDSSMADTKTGRGKYLALTLQIIDGNHKDRLVWDRLTLVHDNPKTVEIAQRQLSSICHALGMLRVQDSAELHGKPLRVRVKFVPATDQYQAKNEIASYKSATGAPAASAPSFAAPAPAAQPWNTPSPASAQAAAKPADDRPFSPAPVAPIAQSAPAGSPPWLTKAA